MVPSRARRAWHRILRANNTSGVFLQAAVAHAGVAPELFDDAKGELDLCAHAGFVPIAVRLLDVRRSRIRTSTALTPRATKPQCMPDI